MYEVLTFQSFLDSLSVEPVKVNASLVFEHKSWWVEQISF